MCRSDGGTFTKGSPVGAGPTGEPFDGTILGSKRFPRHWGTRPTERFPRRPCASPAGAKGSPVGIICVSVRRGNLSALSKRFPRLSDRATGEPFLVGPTGEPFQKVPPSNTADGGTFLGIPEKGSPVGLSGTTAKRFPRRPGRRKGSHVGPWDRRGNLFYKPDGGTFCKSGRRGNIFGGPKRFPRRTDCVADC